MARNIPLPAPRELVLVADPKAKLRAREEGIIFEGADVAPLRELIASEGVVLRPLYGVSEEWLRRKTTFNDVMMGVDYPLDLSIFYKVTAPDAMLESLADRLRKLDIIQAAYIKPGAEPPIKDHSINFVDGLAPGQSTDNFTDLQVYLQDSSQGGVNARFAWEVDGGKGRGVNLIDVEGAWRFSHQDLAENQCGLVGGIPSSERDWRNHGTAVLGIIGGDCNSFGITGICPEATVRAVSIFGNSEGAPTPNWSTAAAIRLAADMLKAGDIILIEQHLPGPRADFIFHHDEVGYIPIEWWPCNLAAIQYATARGIIVVEAAGNGRENLDDDIYKHPPKPPHGPFPDWWHNPFQRDLIDSGAILVGAGVPPHSVHGNGSGPERSRLDYSNCGNAVDAQGWGDDVVTSGYGGLVDPTQDEDRWYTRRFNGTSSAAAMVAGVLGCLQGVLRARGKALLEPATARRLLQSNDFNSPQVDGPSGTPASKFRIGPRPDLRRLIEHLVTPT